MGKERQLSNGETVGIDELVDAVRDAARLIDVSDASSITVKGRADFATDVDLNIQTFLRRHLEQSHPDIQFYGEEMGQQDADLERPCWVVDPIDGTTNLIHDYRQSAISLALLDGGDSVMAVVLQPFSGELFTAVRGCGAFLHDGTGDHRLSVSNAKSLSDSLIAVGTSPYKHDDSKKTFGVIRAIFDRCADIRRSGSATLDVTWAAAGRVDAYVEDNVKLWDYAAAKLLLTEAGGVFLDYRGTPVMHGTPTSVVCGTPLVVRELVAGGCLRRI